MFRLSLAFLIVAVLGVSLAKNKDPNFKDNRSTIVHLFEWKWKDIAVECETYLGPMGFGGVQTSPVNENLKVTSRNRPWWERYQPISYKLDTRSGNEAEFADMVKRCNAVGVRIYPDIIINHMTGTWPENVGTGGSTVTFATWDYPGVPYTKDHFNQPICTINNYQDPVQVRNCELLDLKDLNQTHPHVRDMTVAFMNKLIDYGAAGFRIDAAKHIWPADLEHIFDRLNDLNTDQGFPAGSRPFIFQEVIDLGGEPIKVDEYLPFGAITEFKACAHLGRVFSGKDQSKWLVNWGIGWGLVADGSGVIFVDNHDNQRGHGAGGDILSYKQPKQYKAAIAFMLGHPYGVTRIMSSFAFTDPEVGPPMDANEDIISPIIQPDGLCDSNWVCEHRWTAIAGMIGFRNEVQGELLDEWWDNDASQIAFCRGQKGFIAINTDGSDLNGSMQTCLPAGTYCDVITGRKEGDSCTGKSVTVDATGEATISIPFSSDEAVLAIHTGAKLGSDNTPTTSTSTSGTTGTTPTPGQCPSGQVAISINMDSGSFAGCLTRV